MTADNSAFMFQEKHSSYRTNIKICGFDDKIIYNSIEKQCYKKVRET